MTPVQPRGTVQRSYRNQAGEQVWLVAWTKGHGPSAVVSAEVFETGQAVTLTRAGELARLRGAY